MKACRRNGYDFISLEKNNARVQQMNFHLGEFYYRKQNFPDAAKYYEDAVLPT
jgi:TolA-binding protein